MKIPFEHDNGYCMTPCPYGKINVYTGELIFVGSNACASCICFVTDDFEEDLVECWCGEK